MIVRSSGGVLAGLAGPAVYGGALALTYRATQEGMPQASASEEVVPGGDSYRLEGEMETRGVVGLFSRWHHRAVSVGRLAADGSGIAAARHRGDGIHNGEVRFIQILYGADGAKIEAAQPDPDERSESRRVPSAMKAGTVDPLRAFYHLALKLETGKGCAGTMRIFDGR